MNTSTFRCRQVANHPAIGIEARAHAYSPIRFGVDKVYRRCPLDANLMSQLKIRKTLRYIRELLIPIRNIRSYVMPLSCLLILFDFVVHNPEQSETGISLAHLDIAGGNFSRFEFASKGTLPGSLIVEFAHLARQYVTEKRQQKKKSKTLEPSTNGPVCSAQPQGVQEAAEAAQPVVILSGDETGKFSQMTNSLPILPQEPMAPGLSILPMWSPTALHDADELFLPLIDDPSYHIDGLDLLGIDLKDLFDHPYPLTDGAGL